MDDELIHKKNSMVNLPFTISSSNRPMRSSYVSNQPALFDLLLDYLELTYSPNASQGINKELLGLSSIMPYKPTGNHKSARNVIKARGSERSAGKRSLASRAAHGAETPRSGLIAKHGREPAGNYINPD
jgi:hypothetical protein